MKKKLKFEFAPQDEVGYMEKNIGIIIKMLIDQDMSDCFVSDESTVDHFSDMCQGFSEGELTKFSDELGVPIRNEDLVVDVARRMSGLI